MANTSLINRQSVSHLAKLAALNLTSTEADRFTDHFGDTLKAVSQLNELNTQKLAATPQVTALTNRLRSDEVDRSAVLSPEQALSNANRVHQNYFVVPSVLQK